VIATPNSRSRHCESETIHHDNSAGRGFMSNARLMKVFPSLVFATLALAALIGVVVFTLLQRSKTGKLPFTVWKAISNDAYGGRYVDINGIRIYYETYGHGEPILVLHGGGGSLENMSHQIRALAPGHLVIAPDSRGQGRSTDSDAPLSYGLMADDMAKLLDHLQIESTDIVGWSDGGVIALDMAMRHAERVRRLVAIGANYDAAGLIIPAAADGPIPPTPGFYQRIAPDPAHWPVLHRKLAVMWATQPHYTLGELGGIKAPTLIIAGEFDIAKREHTDQLARAIPGSEEYIVPGGTHGVIWENADLVNAKILEFLKPAPSPKPVP
jgi:pimeloyl-ACP methyl ester carboxylesterase